MCYKMFRAATNFIATVEPGKVLIDLPKRKIRLSTIPLHSTQILMHFEWESIRIRKRAFELEFAMVMQHLYSSFLC